MDEYAKRKKLLQIMCFQSQVLGYFTKDEPLRCYTLHIINTKKLRRRCHVDMTAKGVCVSIVEGSGSEGDTDTTGNTK
jgi:hypothetical protein